LTFDVTESVAITAVDRARRFSRALGEMGCGFALDDFGSGFASFSNLKHLPFDEVKIDGEFIDDLATSPVNQLIVRSVVEIARGLGMKTVAECVGDDATIELLRGYGVDFAQGFHIGRPVPTEELSGQPLRSLR
jgi:EAL domain-containing protein (putative c-di-GMP-specific phosphodiesterase class I)